jgi:hypothetical protein
MARLVDLPGLKGELVLLDESLAGRLLVLIADSLVRVIWDVMAD